MTAPRSPPAAAFSGFRYLVKSCPLGSRDPTEDELLVVFAAGAQLPLVAAKAARLPFAGFLVAVARLADSFYPGDGGERRGALCSERAVRSFD